MVWFPLLEPSENVISNPKKSVRHVATTDALNLENNKVQKFKSGGLVLFKGHGDLPEGHSKPGTDAPGTSYQGKYKPTMEQHFVEVVAREASKKSSKIDYQAPMGRFGDDETSNPKSNWGALNILRKKGEAAVELHFDAYGYEGGKLIQGSRGLLSGGNTPLNPIEKNLATNFGTHPASGRGWPALMLELDPVNMAPSKTQDYVNLLVKSVEDGEGQSSDNSLVSSSEASGGGGKGSESSEPASSGIGVQAVLKAAEENIGLSAGVSEQCANTTRAILAAAGHPSAQKTTTVGDLEPDGVPTQYRAPSYAASFGGTDMGTVTENYRSTKPGDVVLWKGTYGVEKWGPDAITHVGIKGEGSDVYHHGKSPGWRKESGYPLANKFAAGITLNGTGQANSSKGKSSSDGTTDDNNSSGGKLKNLATVISGLLANELAFMQLAGIDVDKVAQLLGAQFGVDINVAKEAVEKAQNETSSNSGDNKGGTGDTAKSNKPYDIASSMGFSKKDWDIYRNVVGNIESGNNYDPKNGLGGGSGGHYSGRWQLGEAAKMDASAYLGEAFPGHGESGSPERRAFLNDPDMQERYFAAFTAKNHSYLSGNADYDKLSTREKFQVLGYAHNQGAGGAADWLATGEVRRDGFGTAATKYSTALAEAYGEGKKTGGKVGKGGSMVPTMLEPGERVFMPGQWDSNISALNKSIPRFQTGGVVGMTGKGVTENEMSNLEANALEKSGPQIITVPVPMEAPVQQKGSSNAVIPAMPSGPSVAFLSDVINRTNMGGVFS